MAIINLSLPGLLLLEIKKTHSYHQGFALFIMAYYTFQSRSCRPAVYFAVLSALSFSAWADVQDQENNKDSVLPEIQVKANTEKSNTLPPVAPGGQAATGARVGILGNKDLLDTPFSMNSYTAQLIKDTQARTLADVLQNDAAVRFETNSGHMLEHFNIRGMRADGQDAAFNGLYGVAPNGHIPMEFIERVEVLRGPSALLTGMSPLGSVGGMINIVTKRATDKDITDLTLSYSSKSYGQAHLDVGRRLGEEKRFGIRFNGVSGDGDTGVESQEKKRELGTIALDYQGDTWRANLDVYNSREYIKDGSPGMYNFTQVLGQMLSAPDGKSNMFRGTHGMYKNTGYALHAEKDFNKDWTAYLNIGGSNNHGSGLMFGTRVIVTNTNGDANGYIYNVTTKAANKTYEAGVRGAFETGSIKHQVVASYSYLNHKEGTTNRPLTGYAQNIYDPVTPDFPDSAPHADYSINNDLTSLALADTLDILDGKILLTLGARLQNVEQKLANYEKSAVTPAVGVVFKPWSEDTSLYANYIEGLSAGSRVGLGYVNEGQVFAPLKTKQTEIGIKQRLGSFNHTFSLYQTKRPTLIAENVAGGQQMVDGGEQRVKGVEWSTYGQLTDTVSLLGGVSYMHAKQENTGKDSFGVPDWTANLNTQWRTPIEGLSLIGRVVYTGEQWIDSANTLKIDSWTRYDAGAKYETIVGRTPVILNAFVENLKNDNYWVGMFGDGFVMPSAQRTLRLSATISF